MNRRALLGAAAALLTLLLVVSVPAVAHANLLSSDPPAGARLETAPARVTVTLSEPIDPAGSGLEVQDDQHRRVDLHDLTIDNGPHPTLTIGLPTDLIPGAYRILWHALSNTDQHTTSGQIGFALGAFEPPSSAQTSPATLRAPAIIARTLVFGGYAVAAGALLFLLHVDGDPTRRRPTYARLLTLGASLHVLGTLLLFQDASATSHLSIPTLAVSSVGRILALRVLAAALLLLVAFLHQRTPSPPYALTSAVLLAFSGLGSARFGHNSLHGPLAIANDWLHLTATTLWTGGLLVFLLLLARAERFDVHAATARSLGERFGRVALLLVSVLAATGIIATFGILGAAHLLDPTMWTAPYGLVLLAKVLLALAMVGIAAINRYGYLAAPGQTHPLSRFLSHRIEPIPADPLRPRPAGFRSLVRTEAVTGALVLVLAAILTSISPPTQGATQTADELRLAATGDHFSAALHLGPPPRAGGSSELRVYLTNLDTNTPETNNTCGNQACMRLSVRPEGTPAENGEQHVLRPEGDGWWTTDPLLFVDAGNTTLTLALSTAYVYHDEIEFTFPVP